MRNLILRFSIHSCPHPPRLQLMAPSKADKAAKVKKRGKTVVTKVSRSKSKSKNTVVKRYERGPSVSRKIDLKARGRRVREWQMQWKLLEWSAIAWELVL